MFGSEDSLKRGLRVPGPRGWFNPRPLRPRGHHNARRPGKHGAAASIPRNWSIRSGLRVSTHDATGACCAPTPRFFFLERPWRMLPGLTLARRTVKQDPSRKCGGEVIRNSAPMQERKWVGPPKVYPPRFLAGFFGFFALAASWAASMPLSRPSIAKGLSAGDGGSAASSWTGEKATP